MFNIGPGCPMELMLFILGLAVLIALATFLVYYFSSRAQGAKDNQIKQVQILSDQRQTTAALEITNLHLQIAGLNAETAKAKEGMAQANVQIVGAKKDAADAFKQGQIAVVAAEEAKLKQEELRQQNIQLATRLNEAIADAHNTKIALTQAQETLAVTQQKQAEAQLAQQRSLQAVKERQKPRVLTLVQQKQLAHFLTDRPKGFIKIVCALGDDESLAFASQLDQTVRSAGWSTVGVSQANFSINPIGLTINLEPTLDGASAVPRANALVEGLSSIGLAVQHSDLTGLPGVGMETNSPSDNTIELVVGVKPTKPDLPAANFQFRSPYNSSVPTFK